MKSHGLLHESERIPDSRPSSAEKERRRKKIRQEMLFVDLLIAIEKYWGYQYLSNVNNEFLTESWEAVMRSGT